jgi:hypothetical protein
MNINLAQARVVGAEALYQGTTLVVPQTLQTRLGFSP